MITGFALSCFGILLFLWITFGGPTPFKAKSYEVTIPFDEAAQLAQQSDVRISGVNVGKVKNIERDPGKLAIAKIEIDDKYAPIPVDTRAILRTKTLLSETYVELTTGDRDGPKLDDGARLLGRERRRSVQIDEIFRTFDPKTRARLPGMDAERGPGDRRPGPGALLRARRTRHHLRRIRQTLPRPRHPGAGGQPALQQRRRRPQTPSAAAKASSPS